MRKEMRFMAKKMSTELQSLKSDILTKCSELGEKCDALAQKYTSLEDGGFNKEACLGEVEEAKIASDMKLDTLASEIESLKKGDRRAGGLQSPKQPAIFRVGSRDTGGKFSSLCQKSGSGAERRTESNQTLDRRRHFQSAPHRTVSNRRPPSDDRAVLEVEG